MRVLDVAAFHAHHAVNACFGFNGYDDHVALQLAINRGALVALVDRGIDEEAAIQAIERVHSSFGDLSERSPIPYLVEEFSNAYGLRMRDAVRSAVSQVRSDVCYPPAVIDFALSENEDADEVLGDWRSWWLYSTDVGLIYRVYRECLAVQNGYEKVFGGTPQGDPTIKRTQALSPPPIVVDVGIKEVEKIACG